ncbi:Vancomycin resistance protein YoaR, contains peptidoglycan-binding and VanW domains [Anaerobium acetethylicum]|uniref:Vancomycin resistance protein YoaR, contains peptidoglycan-binding and VanW domains n=2 Tax=Anaerobium acetethylicum TaxID=1619234 RepID=A0A1D3TX38_9FIRM|nr:Vancomycin resistance protein YoaR, contains peptidoglycan-binding and VanW domains [Anaerobium acetethylicum]
MSNILVLICIENDVEYDKIFVTNKKGVNKMKIRERLLSVVILLMVIMTFGTTAYATGAEKEDTIEATTEKTDNDTENTISKGVFVGDIEISGMTTEEAAAAVDAYIADLNNKTLTFDVNGNEVKAAVSELGLTWENRGIIDEASELGKTGNIVKRYKDLKDLEKEPHKYEAELKADTELIKTMVEEKCTKYNVEAVDGTLKKNGGEFSFVAGTQGVEVNVEKSVEGIAAFLLGSWNKQDASCELAIDTVAPKGTAEELSKVKDVLGTFTTSYGSSGADRSGNVATGAKHINGTVVYPGETFSVYEAVSPFTAANGYFVAGAYLNGMVVDSVGGGICQVSTTLYNAVLRAELEVVERSNHSMIVTYVDPAADAAIAGTYKDFKFKNNSDAPVYIESYTGGKKVTFNIYGQETRSAGRKVEFRSETLSTTEPPADVVTADPSLSLGTVKVTQSSHRGYVAKLYKIVYENGVQVSKEEVNKSTYKAAPKYVSVGTAGASAEAAATIAAQAAAGDTAGAKATAQAAAAQNAAAEAAAAAAAQQQVTDPTVNTPPATTDPGTTTDPVPETPAAQ